MRSSMDLPKNCGDVRDQFSGLFDGTAGLTERALIEAHVEHCAACCEELEQLQETTQRRQRASAVRRLTLTGGTLAVVLMMAVAAYLAYGTPDFQRSGRSLLAPSEKAAPPTALLPSQTAPAASEKPVADGEPRAGEPTPTQPPMVTSPPAEPEARRPIDSALRPRTVAPAPKSRPSAISAEAKGGRRSRTDSREESQASQRVPPSTDVLGQLTVRDRSEAERKLAGLLAGVDGTGRDWQRRGSGVTELVAVVPQLNYSKFTEGLAKIGAWQVEARRSALPEMVRVTVKLIE